MKKWFWLSFADPDKCLGLLVIQAASFPMAVLAANLARLHPGGEVLGVEIPEENMPLIPEEFRNRLLTPEEVILNLQGKKITEFTKEQLEQLGLS